MKNPLLNLLHFILFTLLFSCDSDNDRDYPNSQQKAQIQQSVDKFTAALQSQMADQPIGIGLYVLEKGEGMYFSSGFPEEYGENINFRIASNSKTFTAASILKMHQEGLLDIDHPITNNIPNSTKTYIPDTPEFDLPHKSEITIRQLLQHRSGVFDVTNSPIPPDADAVYAGEYYIDYVKDQLGEDYTFTFEELISIVAKNKLSDFKPGEDFHYSNTGYNVLGYIVENISGLRLHEYLETNFFNPLQLNNTYSPHLGTDNQLPSPYTYSYVKLDGDYITIDKDNVTGNISEGQIISNPKELALWGKALYGTNDILDENTLAMMLEALPADESHGFYGLGVQAYPVELGYGHDGAHLAYLSTMRYIPEKDRTFVIFTNHLNVDNFIEEATMLYDVLFESMDILDQVE